jgi:protein TonB
MAMRADRIGLSAAIALHVLAVVALLSYEPARKALLSAAPLMVDLIAPPAPEQPKPVPPVELPRPKPVSKRPVVHKPVEAPLLAAPAEAPSPVVVAPPAPSPIEVPAPPAPAATVTQPIYDADYLENPAPLYPAVSRRNGEQGRVVLRVLVGPGGAAEQVQVLTSSGFPRLDDSAREAVRRWRFVPAKRGNEAVQAWVRIPIPFVLN